MNTVTDKEQLKTHLDIIGKYKKKYSNQGNSSGNIYFWDC